MMVSDGARAPLTLPEVTEYLTMSSSDENLDRLLKLAKEQEAQEQAKKYIREKKYQDLSPAS